MATIMRYAGGAFGLGGSIALRQRFDSPGQGRLRQPSVLFGLGTGAVASAIYLTGFDTPVVGSDFWASHALTSLPAGAFFAAFPKKAGQSTVDQVQTALDRRFNGGGGGTPDGEASSERVRVAHNRNNGMTRSR